MFYIVEMLEGLAVGEYRLTGKENHSGTVNETLGQSETGLMIETEDLTETEDTGGITRTG